MVGMNIGPDVESVFMIHLFCLYTDRDRHLDKNRTSLLVVFFLVTKGTVAFEGKSLVTIHYFQQCFFFSPHLLHVVVYANQLVKKTTFSTSWLETIIKLS